MFAVTTTSISTRPPTHATTDYHGTVSPYSSLNETTYGNHHFFCIYTTTPSRTSNSTTLYLNA